MKQRLDLLDSRLKVLDGLIELIDNGAHIINRIVKLSHRLVERVNRSARTTQNEGEFNHGPHAGYDQNDKGDLYGIHQCLLHQTIVEKDISIDKDTPDMGTIDNRE